MKIEVKKGGAEVLLLIMLLVVSVTFAYYYGTQKGKTETIPASPISEAPQKTEEAPSLPPSPTATIIPTSNLPGGWKTYVNQEYGFEISYPPSYQALTDQENLYGWPRAIVLFYDGGQSYDLAIEHWNSQAEYEEKYKNQPNLTVKKVGDVYLTLLNSNFEAEVDQIIETFKAVGSE